uniref:Uncharacterized protein n=1 Tax=viral metagenome TaxID=1070528 RepID=A0A6C0IX62_9ZZZZ
MYNKIINPLTGRNVNITSKLGKTIIHNYINISYQIGNGKKTKNNRKIKKKKKLDKRKARQKGFLMKKLVYKIVDKLRTEGTDKSLEIAKKLINMLEDKTINQLNNNAYQLEKYVENLKAKQSILKKDSLEKFLETEEGNFGYDIKKYSLIWWILILFRVQDIAAGLKGNLGVKPSMGIYENVVFDENLVGEISMPDDFYFNSTYLDNSLVKNDEQIANVFRFNSTKIDNPVLRRPTPVSNDFRFNSTKPDIGMNTGENIIVKVKRDGIGFINPPHGTGKAFHARSSVEVELPPEIQDDYKVLHRDCTNARDKRGEIGACPANTPHVEIGQNSDWIPKAGEQLVLKNKQTKYFTDKDGKITGGYTAYDVYDTDGKAIMNHAPVNRGKEPEIAHLTMDFW